MIKIAEILAHRGDAMSGPEAAIEVEVVTESRKKGAKKMLTKEPGLMMRVQERDGLVGDSVVQATAGRKTILVLLVEARGIIAVVVTVGDEVMCLSVRKHLQIRRRGAAPLVRNEGSVVLATGKMFHPDFQTPASRRPNPLEIRRL